LFLSCRSSIAPGKCGDSRLQAGDRFFGAVFFFFTFFRAKTFSSSANCDFCDSKTARSRAHMARTPTRARAGMICAAGTHASAKGANSGYCSTDLGLAVLGGHRVTAPHKDLRTSREPTRTEHRQVRHCETVSWDGHVSARHRTPWPGRLAWRLAHVG